MGSTYFDPPVPRLHVRMRAIEQVGFRGKLRRPLRTCEANRVSDIRGPEVQRVPHHLLVGNVRRQRLVVLAPRLSTPAKVRARAMTENSRTGGVHEQRRAQLERLL